MPGACAEYTKVHEYILCPLPSPFLLCFLLFFSSFLVRLICSFTCPRCLFLSTSPSFSFSPFLFFSFLSFPFLVSFVLFFSLLLAQGTYAEYSKVPVVRAVSVPDKVTMEQAASALWQGFTAHVLAHSAYLIKPEDKVLIHAAAGGVGTLLVQMAKNAGVYKNSDC